MTAHAILSKLLLNKFFHRDTLIYFIVHVSLLSSGIYRDLQPFKKGIDKDAIDRASEKGTRYQIIDHKLYREKDCMFPARYQALTY